MVADALRRARYLCLNPSLSIKLLATLHFELLNLIFKGLPLSLRGWSISPDLTFKHRLVVLDCKKLLNLIIRIFFRY